MPNLSFPSLSAVEPAAAPGPLLDANVLTAPARALQGVGDDLAKIGDRAAGLALDQRATEQQQAAQAAQAQAQITAALQRYTEEKQAHVDQGILAHESNIRSQTLGTIQQFTRDHPDAPEQWPQFAQEQWQEYQDTRDARADEQGWSADVKQADTLANADFQHRTNIQLEAQHDQALIQQSTARQTALAQTYLDQGDSVSAGQIIGQMNLPTAQKTSLYARLVQSAQEKNVARLVEQDPPTALAQLQRKDPANGFANFPDLDPQVRALQTVKAQQLFGEGQAALLLDLSHAVRTAFQTGGQPLSPTMMQNFRTQADHWQVPQAVVDAVIDTSGLPANTSRGLAIFIAQAGAWRDDSSQASTVERAKLDLAADAFTGTLRDDAKKFWDAKRDPQTALNAPPAKFGEQTINDYFAQVATEDNRSWMASDSRHADRVQAQANALVALHQFITAHPTADESLVARWWGGRQAEAVKATRRRALLDPQATVSPTPSAAGPDAARLAALRAQLRSAPASP